MSPRNTNLVRHTAVYGVGQLLTRLGSVLMLPVYTHYLTPADYGTVAIFDMVAALLAIVAGLGMAQAAQRFHFEGDGERARAAIWSTALVTTALPPIPFLAMAWWWRVDLAQATHGTAVVADLYTLILPTLWLTAVGTTADTYLRTRMRSTISVAINLGGIALNIALNLYLLVVAGLGVGGVLLGNLISTALSTSARTAVMFAEIPPTMPSRETAAVLCRFGAPIAGAALLAAGMHQVDRYLLRLFRDLDQVGLYSLAYTLAQGAASMLMVPFAASWEAVRYEIARDADAPQLYAQAFRAFISAMALLSFGVALFAEEALAVIAPPSYQPAAALVPPLVLAYLAFSMHMHFSVPAYLHKVPQRTLAVFAAGLAINVAANLVLIPPLGSLGAALATLVTFVAFAAIGLHRYSKLERYPYPLAWCAAMIAALVVAFAAASSLTDGMPIAAAVAAKSACWLVAAALMIAPMRRDMSHFGLGSGS